MLRRSDALISAIVAVGDREDLNPEMQARDLEVLQVMHDELEEQFVKGKRELGISEPPA